MSLHPEMVPMGVRQRSRVRRKVSSAPSGGQGQMDKDTSSDEATTAEATR